MARTFIALWPPAPAARTLGALARDAASTHGGRAMPAADLHVTLAFIGELDDARAAPLADRLRTALQGTCPTRDDALVLDRIGGFRGANVTWLGASAPPPWLAPLADAVRAALDAAGVPYDRKPFVPHLTVARGARAPAAAIAPLEVRGWRVALVRSGGAPGADGSRYHVAAWLDAPAGTAGPCAPPQASL